MRLEFVYLPVPELPGALDALSRPSGLRRGLAEGELTVGSRSRARDAIMVDAAARPAGAWAGLRRRHVDPCADGASSTSRCRRGLPGGRLGFRDQAGTSLRARPARHVRARPAWRGEGARPADRPAAADDGAARLRRGGRAAAVRRGGVRPPPGGPSRGGRALRRAHARLVRARPPVARALGRAGCRRPRGRPRGAARLARTRARRARLPAGLVRRRPRVRSRTSCGARSPAPRTCSTRAPHRCRP